MRSRNFILFILSAAALAAFSTPALPQETLAEVPMKMRGVMPGIDVLVNGEGPFFFAIDTGGQGQARADVSLVEKVALRKVGEVQASDGSGRNTVPLDIVGIDSIEFGGLKFTGIEAGSRDYNRAPQVPPIDGILGFGLFSDYLLTLDFAAKKVIVSKGSLPEPDGREVIAFDASLGIPAIEIEVAGKKLTAHLDTGNMAGAFMLPEEFAKSLKYKGEPTVVGRARTITSEIEIKQGTLDGKIVLGGIEFENPAVTYPALRDANVGSRALEGLRLTFDQKNGRMRISRH